VTQKNEEKAQRRGSTSFPPLLITIYNEMTQKKQKEVEKRS
jgi:hypothetical protein